jgi:hypothetical protein
VGLDPDVGESLITWTERQAAEKKGWGRWFARHQAQLFLPVLTLEGWQLSLAGIHALGQRPRQSRLLESGLLLVHFAVDFGFLFVFLTPAQAVVFALVHKALFGLNLGIAFAPKKGTAGASRKSSERRPSKRCRPACLSRGEQ